MEYIDLDGDNFIEYDITTKQCRMFSKSAIENEISINEEQLQPLPDKITDEELLDWAKQNYYSASQRNREVLESSIDNLNTKLSEISEKSLSFTTKSVKEESHVL